MKSKVPEDMILDQEEGMKTDTESHAEFTNEEAAANFYRTVKQRLLNVNHWQAYAGSATTEFRLIDMSGIRANRSAQKGDFLQIDIPGPGTKTGQGDDWVQIEAIEEKNEPQRQITAMTVRPATNPLNNKNDTAHFFDSHATSTFVAKLENTIVTAGVYSRNEKPNTDTESMADKVRNTVVALGAIVGFSKLEWKSLVEGLVRKDSV